MGTFTFHPLDRAELEVGVRTDPSMSGCSVAQLCPTLCNPMDCSTPGLPVLPNLLEFAQTHVR